MNNDVVFEILLHLPVRNLLRFRAVCKLWCYVIDSPNFVELHTLRRNNKDEEVYLKFTFDLDHRLHRKKVSINLLDNGKPLKSHVFPPPTDRSVVVSGVAKGLVCLSFRDMLEIAICNPVLGQIKILPLSPHPCTPSHNHLFCNPIRHNVGFGFDENYKVVQLQQCLQCSEHVDANLYSARTNSWSELDIDQDLVIEKSIKSVCKNGSYAHWQVRTGICGRRKSILSFDMKNEVFRTITIPGDEVHGKSFEFFAILAKGGCSFVILVSDRIMMKVYESSGEGSELIWNSVNNVKLNSFWRSHIQSDDIPIWRNGDCVVLRGRKPSEVILYDYRARKFMAQFKMPRSSTLDDDIIEYEGSLISP
ncbi:putative F-box protein [Salvia divinorum]|uniref:F-box protein n=1 Tax=Salvia divinorum TaxID=28513 RepID=A0ABD1FUT9_SALDI